MADPSPTGAPKRRISWATRILAPLALLATLGALYAIVTSADVGGDDKASESRSAEGGSGSDSKPDENKDGPENPRTYVVEEGDTLSTIAAKFDVSVERLERLNRDVDPQALTTGQDLTIR